MKNRTINIILVVFVIYVLAMLATACGSDDGYYDNKTEQQVKTCISQGGDPKYTTDKYGYVVTYLGCVKP